MSAASPPQPDAPPAAPAARSIALSDARPMWQSMSIFLLPLMASNVLQSLSATANSIYLGRLIGVGALASVSAIFPIIFFLISFLIGIGSGSTVLIGQAYGARDPRRVKQIAGTTIALSLALGTIVGVLGGIFAEPLLVAVGTPADVLAGSVSYARITFFSMPILFTYLIYTTFLRGTGDTQTPFYVLIASTALVLVISPAFIAGYLGLPRLGIDGAAAANVVATLASLAGMLVYLRARAHPLAFDAELLSDVRFRPALVRQIVRIGIPTGLNLVMISLSEVAVLTFVNRFGSTATAAYGAVNQIVSYVQFPAVSIGIATSIFGAQAIGAQRLDRIPKIVRSGVTLNYVAVGALAIACYAGSRAIISLFVTDPKTVDIAETLLRITLWSYAIFGNARVLSGLMLSSGAVVWPTLISIGSIWGIEVPVAWVLSNRIGLDGVWYGYPAAFVASLIGQYAYFQFVWKRRPLVRIA